MIRMFRDSARKPVTTAARAALIGTTLRAATVLSATVLTLASCAVGTTAPDASVGPVASAEPSASATASPTSTLTASPTEIPTAACPESESQGPWGDVVAAEQITDAAGSYCHTTINPAAAAAQFDPSVVDLESLTTYGFTIDDAEAAHLVTVTYVAEQALDSSRLDDYSVTDSAWFDSAKGTFSPAAQARLAPSVASYGLRDSGVIVTQSLPSPLPRTGGPRATNTEISVDKIFATLDLDQVTPLLIVRVPVSAAYSATDAAIVEAAIGNERGTSSLSEEALTVSTPSLFDGSDDEGLVLTGGFNVGFGTGNMDAIAYVGAAWVLSTGDGALQVDSVEPETDPAER